MAKKESKQPIPANNNSEIQHESYVHLPLVRINFIIMGIAVLMIILGFILISGGAPADTNQFNPEVFSTRRIVIGPTITFLGFVLMGVGIMWNGRRHNDSQAADDTTADA